MANRVSTGFVTRTLALFLVVALAFPIFGQTQTRTAAAPSPETLRIADSQIADEAMRLKQQLRGFANRVGETPLLTEIEQQVNEVQERIGQRASETKAVIQSGATFAELQQSFRDWQALNKQVAGLTQALARHAAVVDEQALSLLGSKQRWEQTYKQLKAAKSPKALVDLTMDALNGVRDGSKRVEEQRLKTFELQQTVLTQGLLISEQLENTQIGIRNLQRSLFERDSPPLWSVQFQKKAASDLSVSLLSKSYVIARTRLRSNLRANRDALFGIAILAFASLMLFIRMNRRAASLQAAPGPQAEAHNVFRRPLSLALLLGLVATMPLLFEAPPEVRGLVDLFAVVPVTRLLMPRLSEPFRKMLLALIVSVMAWELVQSIQLPIWIGRDLLAILAVAVIVLFWKQSQRVIRRSVPLGRAAAITIRTVQAGLLLLVVSLFANILGYFGLSKLIGTGTLVSGYRAASLYAIFIAGTSIIWFVLQTNMTRSLAVVRGHTARIARGLSTVLALLTLIGWVHTTLTVFAIRNDVYQAIHSAFFYRITIGSFGFVPSNLLVFFLTLYLGYLVASMTSAILGEEILPRLHLARGLPDAITTVTHYVGLLIVFVLALAVGGVELSKFTVLTGAFGVGVGFGLQNVVNNFFSGLVLLFERPVRVGDSLEVGGVYGLVTKIGFRSSTLHSPDGADLIVPNANLISQQVINWTLSGTRRRVSMRVRVAYGNDPSRVRELLLATASEHPDVLKTPAPDALFLGFGESALDFEIFFWSPNSDIAFMLKSQVALRVAEALRDAGIEVPFPQRDLHFKTTVEPAREIRAMQEKKAR